MVFTKTTGFCFKIKQSRIIFAVFIFTIFFFSSLIVFPQKKSDVFIIDKEIYTGNEIIDIDKFIPELFVEVLLHEINQTRLKYGADSVEINQQLAQPAALHAKTMSETDNIAVEQGGKKLKTTALRMQYFGLMPNGYELTAKTATKGGYEPMTYLKAAKDIVFKWYNNKKSFDILTDNTLIFAGIANQINLEQKKIYTSCVLANYTAFNELPDTLPPRYQFLKSKNKFTKNIDETTCKKTNQNLTLLKIQEGLYCENGKVFLKTDRIKDLNRLLKNKKDGIAVDVIQKSQFDCQSINYINYALPYAGIPGQLINAAQITKTKFTDTATGKTIIPMGFIPAGINAGNCEFNLLLIRNKKVCASFLPHIHLKTNTAEYFYPVKLVADTITINAMYDYRPIPDTTNILLTVRFEKSRFSISENEAEYFNRFISDSSFKIIGIKITAYSSIEGESQENENLQKQRAYSVVEMLRAKKLDYLITDINTGFAWEQFKKDISATDYKNMAFMAFEQARQYITNNNLTTKLEYILSKHRLTQVELKVIKNINGSREYPFVLEAFNKAIENKDLPLALAIQKYMMKKLILQKYPATVIGLMNIPDGAEYAGLMMNKIWLEIHINGKKNEEFYNQIKYLNQINPKNDYILFNKLYCSLLFDKPANDREILQIQNQLDRLYSSTFTKQTVDGLNLRFQFRFLALADSIKIADRNNFNTQILNRIKLITDIRDESAINAFKLAQLFISYNDYEYALKLMEPFVVKQSASEEMLFTYLELCSWFPKTMLTKRFANALRNAYTINPKRYCNLFANGGFPRQVFINKKVKADYCKWCQ